MRGTPHEGRRAAVGDCDQRPTRIGSSRGDGNLAERSRELPDARQDRRTQAGDWSAPTRTAPTGTFRAMSRETSLRPRKRRQNPREFGRHLPRGAALQGDSNYATHWGDGASEKKLSGGDRRHLREMRSCRGVGDGHSAAEPAGPEPECQVSYGACPSYRRRVQGKTRLGWQGTSATCSTRLTRACGLHSRRHRSPATGKPLRLTLITTDG